MRLFNPVAPPPNKIFGFFSFLCSAELLSLFEVLKCGSMGASISHYVGGDG